MLFNFPVEGLPCLGTLLRSPGFVHRVCLLPGFALGGPAWGMAMKLGCGEAQTAERDEPHSRTATHAPHPSILHQRFHLCSQESSLASLRALLLCEAGVGSEGGEWPVCPLSINSRFFNTAAPCYLPLQLVSDQSKPRSSQGLLRRRLGSGRFASIRRPPPRSASSIGPARSPSRRWSHPLTYRWPPLLFTTAGVLPVLPLDYLFIRIKC